MDAIARWLPLLIIVVGFIVLIGMSTRSYRKQIDRVQQINDEILANNQEMVAELREIKEILKDQN